ncbi:cuticle protein 8-like [Homarus americanus]|uniref:Pro-resilin-like 122 n=1 Tax=Homarus americanus TaxID=6706 RepID=A0A8J5MSB1_HOMAM|nr:cuticle protein 8-like [Homarus americanus]KAG7161677.1 Pro-resilin-like 122 [Homarus americanus]
MIFQVAVAVLVVVVGALAHPDGYEPAYPSEPLPYHFNYAVHDDYKGTHFGQNEKSDGDAVYGSYTVALPDGRKQTVDYTADHYKGFVAKVSYDGQAKHPKHYGPAVTFKQNGGGYH